MPITIANVPTLEAKNAVLSAVSLIQTWRAALLCGRPVLGP